MNKEMRKQELQKKQRMKKKKNMKKRMKTWKEEMTRNDKKWNETASCNGWQVADVRVTATTERTTVNKDEKEKEVKQEEKSVF